VLFDMAHQREQAGDHDGALQLYREAATAGDTFARRDLARLREQAGDHDGAEQLYREAAAAGNIAALDDLARLRGQAGDHDGAPNPTVRHHCRWSAGESVIQLRPETMVRETAAAITRRCRTGM
jgi:TPR repeat protein